MELKSTSASGAFSKTTTLMKLPDKKKQQTFSLTERKLGQCFVAMLRSQSVVMAANSSAARGVFITRCYINLDIRCVHANNH